MSCPCGLNIICIPIRGQISCQCKQGFVRGYRGHCVAEGDADEFALPILLVAALFAAFAAFVILSYCWKARSVRNRRLHVELRDFERSTFTQKLSSSPCSQR